MLNSRLTKTKVLMLRDYSRRVSASYQFGVLIFYWLDPEQIEKYTLTLFFKSFRMTCYLSQTAVSKLMEWKQPIIPHNLKNKFKHIYLELSVVLRYNLTVWYIISVLATLITHKRRRKK